MEFYMSWRQIPNKLLGDKRFKHMFALEWGLV